MADLLEKNPRVVILWVGAAQCVAEHGSAAKRGEKRGDVGNVGNVGDNENVANVADKKDLTVILRVLGMISQIILL